MPNRSFSLRILLIVAVIACLSTVAAAQFNATIQGTVLDPSGAVVPKATITVTNLATGVSVNTTSSDAGYYRVAGLPPGKYKVSVAARGFRTQDMANVEVAAETPRGLDVKLQTGTATETVTVTGEAPALQTETSAMSGNLDTRQVRELPKFGSDPYSLARLAPGVFGNGARTGNGSSSNLPNSQGPGGSNSSVYQVENVVQISANGQRLSANSYSIDGVSVNSQTWGGAAVVTPNEESVKELQVVTGTYTAEESRTAGAQVKVISQAGTNSMHGSAFFRYDDPSINGYNQWGGPNNAAPVKNQQKLRQFGGSVGGPVMKSKLFYFFSVDANRVNNQTYADSWITTDQFNSLLASARPGGIGTKIVSSPGMQPRIAQVLTPSCGNFSNSGWPCAVVGQGIDIGSPYGSLGQYVPVYSTNNRTGGGLDGIPDLQNVRVSVPNRSHALQYNARSDYTMGNNQFAVSGYLTTRDDLNADAAGASRPAGDIAFKPKNTALMASWIRTISPTLLNEFRFNATRYAFNTVKSSSSVNWGIPRIEIEDMPIDRVRFGAPQGETSPASFAENTFEFRDVMSKLIGSHAFKFGGEIISEQDNNNLVGGARPIYTFATPWNFFNDTALFESINTDPRTGKPGDAQRHFRTRNYGMFFQDDWKLKSNLTLNLGLRYEYFTPLRETNNQISNLVISPTTGLAGASVKTSDQLFNPDRNNFAPRVGFAWSPLMFNNKTVLRGGVGVSYNRVPNSIWANTRGNPPFLARWGLCCATAPGEWGDKAGTIQYSLGTSNLVTSYPINPALVVPFGTNGLPTSGAVELYGAPANVPNAYVYSFSMEVQQELPWKMVGTVGYAGSQTRKLLRLVNQKFIYDPPNGNPNISAAYFGTPDVNANYNALITRLDRRFSNGLQFVANYRWGRSMDTLSNEGPGFTTNQTYPRDQRYEYGPSDYDVKHNFNFAWTYELPIFRAQKGAVGSLLGGWAVSGIWSANSGFPWTPTSDQCNQLPSQEYLCPVRPIAYKGGAPVDSSNYRLQNANFPGGGLAWFTPAPNGPIQIPGIGRNSFRGPGYKNVDLSLAKNFALGFTHLPEQSRLEFRMNLFNAFNILNLTPIQFGSGTSHIQDSNFGMSPGATAGRTVELQARFSF